MIKNPGGSRLSVYTCLHIPYFGMLRRVVWNEPCTGTRLPPRRSVDVGIDRSLGCSNSSTIPWLRALRMWSLVSCAVLVLPGEGEGEGGFYPREYSVELEAKHVGERSVLASSLLCWDATALLDPCSLCSLPPLPPLSLPRLTPSKVGRVVFDASRFCDDAWECLIRRDGREERGVGLEAGARGWKHEGDQGKRTRGGESGGTGDEGSGPETDPEKAQMYDTLARCAIRGSVASRLV